ncbi:OsmC family protein [Alicyclobacillus ferrooxydans]|uniref:Peroxiredoxin n=1 Tax=Alicyclobacillus ferrooxydans TaxID=471514 RepID=A0A0P9EKI5_9BACL|nr:OsmC family protein [Alicyclobacillus ferrooxydans]KPV43634.1 peroxiredoxin [Alicyclobacillus ferrooxydans]
MEMNVKTTWQGKRHFLSQGPSGYQVSMDAKEEAGGEDKGNRPMELLLMGLTGCTGIDIAMIIERMRLPMTGMHIDAQGTRREEHPQAFTEITLTYHIDGDIPPAKAWRAIHLSEEKYCSASASLNAKIIPQLVLNGQSMPEEQEESLNG